MMNLSSLGITTSLFLSVFLGGTDITPAISPAAPAGAYVVNNSQYVIYYKPESRLANPGLQPDEAYPIQPGETLYAPVDAIVTPAIRHGRIYRVPTGGRIIIGADGKPEPANIIAKGGLMLPAYGEVEPPCDNFSKLANEKKVLYHLPDIIVAKNF